MVTPANDYIILVGNDWLRMVQSDLMLSRGISQTKSEHSKFLCEISGQLSNSLFCCDIARRCGGHCLLRRGANIQIFKLQGCIHSFL